MPSGKLLTVSEGSFDGVIEIQNSLKTSILGNENRKYSTIFELKRNIDNVFLIIFTEAKNPINKWRVWVNQFSLTKEFKPNFEIQLENNRNYYIIFYDITPIVKNNVEKYEVVVEYSGADPLKIDNISLISFYKIENFNTNYKLNIGKVLLKASEELRLNGLGKNILMVRNPNSSKMIIFNNNKLYEFLGPFDNEEFEFEGSGEIIVRNEGNSNVGLSITSFHTMQVKEPRIELDLDANLVDGILRFNVVNVSEIDLDRVIINVMVNGITKFYKICDNFKVGISERYEIPISANNGIVSLRIVGIKAGIRKIFEKQYKLKK